MSPERRQVPPVYEAVKEMAVSYAFRPGERINEGALAARLGVSRTPVREVLNRLASEGFLAIEAGRGFVARELEARDLFDLYETRAILEVAAAQLACERASDADLVALRLDLHANGLAVDGRTIRQLVATDEAFHIAIARLSGNRELTRRLANVNERIRFVRWLDMEHRVAITKGEHKAICAALGERDAVRCGALLRDHIGKRLDQVREAARTGYAMLYVPDAGEIHPFDRPLSSHGG